MIPTGRSVRFVGPIYLRSSLGGTFDVSQRRLIRSCKVLVFKSYVPALLRATGKRYCGVCWRAAPHRHAQWCVQAAVSGAVPVPSRHPDAGRISPAGRRIVRRDLAHRTTNAGRTTVERSISPVGRRSIQVRIQRIGERPFVPQWRDQRSLSYARGPCKRSDALPGRSFLRHDDGVGWGRHRTPLPGRTTKGDGEGRGRIATAVDSERPPSD